MTANLAGGIEGDFPWLEAQRGGRRQWSEGAAEAWGPRPSVTVSASEPDDGDFEALKEAALAGLGRRRRARTVVLPPDAQARWLGSWGAGQRAG